MQSLSISAISEEPTFYNFVSFSNNQIDMIYLTKYGNPAIDYDISLYHMHTKK